MFLIVDNKCAFESFMGGNGLNGKDTRRVDSLALLLDVFQKNF